MQKVVVDAAPSRQQQYAETLAHAMLAEDSGLFLYQGQPHRMLAANFLGEPEFEAMSARTLAQAFAADESVVAVGARGVKAVPEKLVQRASELFAKGAARRGKEVAAVVRFPVMVRRDGWQAMRDIAPGVRDGVAMIPSECAESPPVVSSDAEFREQVGRLMAPLEEFAFMDARHKALALAAMLTAANRATLRTAPCVVIEAPQPRSGKTLLAETICAMVPQREDVDRCAGTAAATDEELDKRIMANARQPVMLIDNLRRRLASQALEAMLTAGHVDVREAGQWKETEQVVTRALLAVTGNNIDISDDMRRRALNIRLLGEMNPQDKPHSFDPLERVREQRGAFAGAAVAILEYAQGREGRQQEQWLRDVSPDFADLIAPAVRLACRLMPETFEWPRAVVDEALSPGGDAETVRSVIEAAIAVPEIADRMATGMLNRELLDDPQIEQADVLHALREVVEGRVRGSRAWNARNLGTALRQVMDVPCDLGCLTKTKKRKSTAHDSGAQKWQMVLTDAGKAALEMRRAELQAEQEAESRAMLAAMRSKVVPLAKAN
ncbi:hypothetical protein [Paraburkholderia tropica]|uniref:Uncharacterized protein n=1 Tax=Paraburkholderia tropica TaxID=92647 RepID=A0AAQ1JV27_9BURK|nr:hypothetical protein [Paraburkholderia tropica]RQN38550.1 hypothetical protein EHZ25_12375 [Paraburkholderia tropica]SEJ88481.1 hypothetical protein SAMN05216550_1105 [Paraburkholderia tropica]